MNKVISIKPVPLGGELQARVTAPVERDGALPVVVFSHGYGSSMEAYGPLTDYWAAHGLAVVQPNHTHDTDPQGWRMRVDDVRRVLDQLALVEAGFTVDRDRIAVAGHSFGGQTAGNLLGLQVRDPETGTETALSDTRVKAGVLLATAGRGTELTPYAAEHYPFMNPRFDRMRTPALVVAGDNDNSPLSTRGPEWMTDPYHLSPGPKSLLMVPGGEHSLGGIPGYDARETTDASPERLDLVRRVTLAYLQHALGIDDTAWKSADVESK
ncbi:alpha/beta hydrolase family protein [Kribbella soli]|uniref:Alpha/beta fold hydrolase n=1 Tax=Kribbella soli TaxID=1124743 RepID=A0A4V2LZB1_9ACTN|nr:alpha/beta fold hydrolase [Kribbella soli]TCC07486.1 alpha/beta fold hydrolase [Kribbella soli]